MVRVEDDGLGDGGRVSGRRTVKRVREEIILLRRNLTIRVLTCTINLSKTLIRIMPCVFICASQLLCYVSKRKLIFLGWGVLVALYSNNKETKVRDSYTQGIIITQRGMFSRTALLV